MSDHPTVREWTCNFLGIPTSNDDPLDTLEEHADADDFFYKIPTLERLSNSWRFCQGLCRRVFQPHDPWVVCIRQCPSLVNWSLTSLVADLLQRVQGRGVRH